MGNLPPCHFMVGPWEICLHVISWWDHEKFASMSFHGGTMGNLPPCHFMVGPWEICLHVISWWDHGEFASMSFHGGTMGNLPPCHFMMGPWEICLHVITWWDHWKFARNLVNTYLKYDDVCEEDNKSLKVRVVPLCTLKWYIQHDGTVCIAS